MRLGVLATWGSDPQVLFFFIKLENKIYKASIDNHDKKNRNVVELEGGEG